MLTNDCNFFHQQTQTVEKPHPCKACVKQFGQRINFFYEQTQLGEKCHPCAEYDKKFG